MGESWIPGPAARKGAASCWAPRQFDGCARPCPLAAPATLQHGVKINIHASWFGRHRRRYSVDSGALVTRFGGMKRLRKSQAPPAPRIWRVSVIRKRLERLGRVTAPDRDAAEAAALAEFHLKDHEAKRLLVEEVP
jgi:hypothetical protein